MNKRTVFILVGLVCLGATMLAEVTFIRDILDNPKKYFNLQVTIQGEVVRVEPPPAPGERGYYILMDNSDKSIKVVANTLPAPQQRLTVTGVVQVETETQTPYLRDFGTVTQPPPPPPPKAGINPLTIVLICLIALVVAAIVFVLLRKPKALQPGQAGATPAAAPAGTRQVSIAEVDARVGGIKTTQVPSLLAELRVMTGSMAGKSFPLKFETTIGRIAGDIVLEDSSVSKEHVRIRFATDKYILENKSTTNPVILNGEKITGQKELKDGDEIICGFIKMQFKLI